MMLLSRWSHRRPSAVRWFCVCDIILVLWFVLQADRVTGDKIRASFAQNVALLRLQAAWDVARVLNQRPFWLALSGKAMETLNISMAIKVYRFLGDAGMVMALEQLQDVEDKNLLAGHIALLFGDYSQVRS
jgi:WD repeat-containing protein 19